jgi:hypothetical protein
MIKTFGSVFTMGLFSISSVAQQNDQLWLDYQLDYPFHNQYLFEVITSYQRVLAKDSWRSLNVTPTFEFQYLNNLDLIGTMPMYYTLQKENFKTYGIDPTVGVRYHFTQNQRFNTRVLFKVEERFFHQVENDSWQSSNRLRLKFEEWIAINGPNLFVDNLWHLILDFEEYFVVDHQLDERYANRRRARIGLGYRLNYSHRFDLIYTLQSARDEIDGDFIRQDNVFQLRYKMFLNAPKATTNNLLEQ